MKNNATKRLLALVLTLVMLLPNFAGTMLDAKADTITAEPNVYDIYDLTGNRNNTILGTDSTWDGQYLTGISEEHKENFVFKTIITVGEQEVRLAVLSKEGNSLYDPQGYAVYMNHNGGSPYITIKRNQSDLVVGSVASVAGTWKLEIGVVDILTDGVRTGKHLYVKQDGVVVCEYDDVDGYLTGDDLGTQIVDFHYGAAMQMDSTYTNTYGEAKVYDIYDLTGAASKSVDPWSPTIIGNIADGEKEQAALQVKMNVTNERHRYRFAVGNTTDGNGWDPQGYAMEIAVQFDGANHVKFLGNGNNLATFDDISAVLGEHIFEFGYRDILFAGMSIGKQIYLKVDGTIAYSFDHMNNFVSGEALGNCVTLNHIDGGAVTLMSAYNTGYADVKVYDIFDITGKAENTINGTGNGNWNVTELGNIDAADKESVSWKANVKINEDKKYRFSFAAKAGDDCVDPAGYGFELNLEGGSLAFVRGGSHTWIQSWSGNTDALKGEYELEFGYRSITFGGNVIGKQIFLKKNGEVLYTYDDMNGFLTGDALGTRMAIFHYGSAIELNSTYESSYGEAKVYDIYDLTGNTSNTIKGTDESWDGQIRSDIPAKHKENWAFKSILTMGAQEIRLSLTAKDGDSHYDPVGYAVYLYGASNKIDIRRNNSSLKSVTVDNLVGTYEFEVGIVDILLGGQRIGKHLYVKLGGVVVCEVDDTNGYLTGDTLGTKIIDFHYGAATQMDTTYENGFGEVKVYDIFDITGKTDNIINGTGNDNWSVTELGNIDAADKESVSWKANVKINEDKKYRFSFAAKAGDDCVDPTGYGFELNLEGGSLGFVRGGSHTWITSWDIDTSVLKGEYELEFGYRSITFNGNVIGKQIFLKKNGEVLYSFDDVDGYLTGDALGTRVAVFHYGTAIELNTTRPSFVNTYNLTLGGSTVMNLRLDPAVIADADATVTVTVAGNTKTYTVKDLPVSEGLWVVSVPLAAAQMQDEVTLTVNLTNGSSMTKSYTVAGYAQVILNGNYTAEQKAVVEAMLHYGTAAQNYFDYNAGNPANAELTDDVNNTIGSNYAPSLSGAVDGISVYGSSLLMVETISLRHYLNITGELSAYDFYINGFEVTPVTSTVEGANYYVQLDGILPNELDGVYVLTITDGVDTIEYDYSPMSYIQRMSTNANMADLVQQLYDYHIAAKALEANKVTDKAVSMDLYQLTGKKSVTVAADGVQQLGVLAGQEDCQSTCFR